MAWLSLDLWHVEVPLVRGTCESWPFERDFAHPKLSRKKNAPRTVRTPPKQEPVRIDSARWRKCGFFFPIFGSWSFEKWPRNACFKGTERYENWKLQVYMLMWVFLWLKNIWSTVESIQVSGFWCYIKSRWRKHTRIRVSIALVIVFGSYFRLEARLSNLKRWCLPTLAWLFGPCRGPRSQMCDGNLHSSHQDAANPTMLHVPKSLHIPWSTEDMSISQLINT